MSDLICDYLLNLGEAPIWHSQRQSWLWVDILEKKIFELKFSQQKQAPTEYTLPKMPSVIAEVDIDHIVVVMEGTLLRLNLSSGDHTEICDLPISDDFRTNDGGVCDNGLLWFSSMHKTSPDKYPGSIYSIDSQLKIKCHGNSIIHIANTFCWLDKHNVLISDSYLQKMYKVPFDGESLHWQNKKLFLDLSTTDAAPDGGAIDERNQLWNAQWGASRVTCYSQSGEFEEEIRLDVTQPSSCCFGGPEGRHLLITSAREGLSNNELQEYPLSGSVFCVALNVKGKCIPSFKMDN